MKYPTGTDMKEVGKRIAADTGLDVKYDDSVVLDDVFITSIKTGTKKHTMKFHQADGKDVIRIPATEHLILYNKPNNMVCSLNFDYVEVKPWGQVTAQDAVDDGFYNLMEFKIKTEKLARKRGFNLTPQNLVSIYHIKGIDWL